jgi:hypothetical protein
MRLHRKPHLTESDQTSRQRTCMNSAPTGNTSSGGQAPSTGAKTVPFSPTTSVVDMASDDTIGPSKPTSCTNDLVLALCCLDNLKVCANACICTATRCAHAHDLQQMSLTLCRSSQGQKRKRAHTYAHAWASMHTRMHIRTHACTHVKTCPHKQALGCAFGTTAALACS